MYVDDNFKYYIDKKVNINSFLDGDHILQHHDDLITLHINSEYKDIVSRDTQQIFSENNKYDKKSSNLIFLENYIKNKKQLDKLDETIFIPHNLKISIKQSGFFHSALYDDRDYYSDENWEQINEVIKIMKNKSFKEYIETLDKLFKYKKEFHTNYNKGLRDLFSDRRKPNKYYFNSDLLKNIPQIISDCDSNNIELNISDIDSDTLKYIEKLPYVFEIDLYDKGNKSFDELSFGEKQLLNQLHYILLHSTKKDYIEWIPSSIVHYGNDEVVEIEDYNEVNKIKNILIFLDEFEIGLHPEWQKKTINYFINFLKILDIKIHIILTSHSPFLLSDIPKQNIIFLDKDEKGNCKVVDGLKEKKQTFGANIHTLLSDSFFMEDGLMGEFAKSKIDKVITLLNQDRLDEDDLKYCEQIISIIGEPIVKNQLQRMLTAKKIDYLAKDTREEIEFLKHRIDLLSKRL